MKHVSKPVSFKVTYNKYAENDMVIYNMRLNGLYSDSIFTNAELTKYPERKATLQIEPLIS